MLPIQALASPEECQGLIVGCHRSAPQLVGRIEGLGVASCAGQSGPPVAATKAHERVLDSTCPTSRAAVVTRCHYSSMAAEAEKCGELPRHELDGRVQAAQHLIVARSGVCTGEAAQGRVRQCPTGVDSYWSGFFR